MESSVFLPTILTFPSLSDTQGGLVSPSWSNTSSIIASNKSSSVSSSLPKTNVLATKKKKGPGRPATARRIWQQPAMKRRLVRLYLYTAESTLSTRQISQLISALARHEENGTSTETSVPLSGVPCTRSEIRSTQYELQSLLLEGYRGLRPRSREEARERYATFRRIRHGRIEKDALHQNFRPHSRSARRSSSNQAISHISSMTPNSHDPADSTPRHSISESAPARLSGAIMDSHGGFSTRSSLHRVHLSWVREKLGHISKCRPSSSICEEIRSLLSRHSASSSLFSYRSSITISDSLCIGLKGARDTLIKLCCSHNRECLHRKFLNTASKEPPPRELRNEGLRDRDFTVRYGRDAWNDTPLHLAARSAPDDTALSLLLQFLDRCEPTLANVKNIDGETFMHIIARRWCSLTILPNETFAFLCSKACAKGFNPDTCNRQGQTFLGPFIHQAESAHISSPQKIQVLTGFSSLLSLPEDIFWSAVTTTSSDRSVSERILECLSHLELCLRAPPNQLVPEHMSLQEQEDALKYSQDVITQYRARLLPLRPSYPPSPNQLHGYLECQNWGPVVDRALFLDILKRGADPNEYNAEGQTCVTAVIQNIKSLRIPEKLGLNLLTLLFQHGADLRLLDHMGNTALHYAVQTRLPNVVHRLIGAGIDVHARNALDETAIQIAITQYAKASQPGVDDSGTSYARSQSTLVRLFGNNRKQKTDHGILGMTTP
ncbi:ankyrin [Xylariaceae sp. AK1471]|nr:ankyrin [Xylariaceae sp. AK1471]